MGNSAAVPGPSRRGVLAYLKHDGLNDSHDDKLRGRRLADHAAVADENCRSCKVAIHKIIRINDDVTTGRAQVDCQKNVDLHSEGGKDEGKADRAQAILLQKSHEVAETDEHHESNSNVHLIHSRVERAILSVEETDPAQDLDDCHEQARKTRVRLGVTHRLARVGVGRFGLWQRLRLGQQF